MAPHTRPEALDHRSFAEGALTRLLVRVPRSLLEAIDAHATRLQRDYPWITVNRSDTARDLLLRAVQALAGDPAPGPRAPQWQPGTARPRLPVALSGVRLQIMTLLREHPGLTPADVQVRLGLTKDLAPTIRSMARDGLLRRDHRERHRAAHSDQRGPAFAPARFSGQAAATS